MYSEPAVRKETIDSDAIEFDSASAFAEAHEVGHCRYKRSWRKRGGKPRSSSVRRKMPLRPRWLS